jgi:histidinol-phosphatase
MLSQRRELLDFSLELAMAAEAQIMPRYLNCVASKKQDGSEVTEADRRAEEAIRELLLRHCPNDGILGEEFGETDATSGDAQWVVDPLDGTAWFTLGVPLFGTLIARLEQGDPVLGVIHFPVTGETVFAGKGLGCWFKTRDQLPVQVHVASPPALSAAVVSASGVHSTGIQSSAGELPYNLTDVISSSGKFRFCGDCLQHALVCRGRIHAAVDTLMMPWDNAAIIPCIEEAGGVVSTLSGEREDVIHGGSLLTSCDETLHLALIEKLRVV